MFVRVVSENVPSARGMTFLHEILRCALNDKEDGLTVLLGAADAYRGNHGGYTYSRAYAPDF